MLEEIRGKRLLILGGSSWKKAISNFANENQITLVATGDNQNAGIFQIADEKYDVNSTDCKKMMKLIKEKKIDGVYMGGSETVISSACEYINELNLPCYCTKKQWNSIQNKKEFKKLCMQYDLPVVPRYEIDHRNFDEQKGKVLFPVITKPADGCGSSGFSVCHDEKELKEGYEFASLNSVSREVIVEKFVKNEGVVVFLTFSNGKMIFSGIEDKYPIQIKENGSYVAGLFILESREKVKFRELFEAKLAKMFQSIDIQEGNIWIEVFHDGENFYFNEAGYRYGGSVTIYPVDYFYEINQVAADIYYSLTGKSKVIGYTPLVNEKYRKRKKYCIYPLYSDAGIISKIAGIEDIEKKENVVSVIMTKKSGDEIKDSGDFSQNVGMVHFVFNNKEELTETISNINTKIQILDKEGNNLLINRVNKILDDIIV